MPSFCRKLGKMPQNAVVIGALRVNPSLVLVQPRKTRPFITERLLMGRKESNQTNKQTAFCGTSSGSSLFEYEPDYGFSSLILVKSLS